MEASIRGGTLLHAFDTFVIVAYGCGKWICRYCAHRTCGMTMKIASFVVVVAIFLQMPVEHYWYV